MSRILFYSPFNQRSRDTESLMLAFRKQGHQVTSLTQQEGFLINDFLTGSGIEALSYVVPGPRSGWKYYLHHLVYFIRFCRSRNIDVVYSHLEPGNFVASIGQYFIKASVYLCRHHIDEGNLYSFDRDLYYRITYRLARKIIVVSEHARQYMIKKEKIRSEKILHINLAYDFALYPTPDVDAVNAIRAQFRSEVLLVSACRLTQFKRPEVLILTLRMLRDNGVDAKLILLGKGEMQQGLERLVEKFGLKEFVFMPGHVNNVLEYMAAGDFFLHPSLLDSSCVAVKEAGLVAKPVIVCNGIGDFEDYIRHGKNGFTVSPDAFASEATEIIKARYADSARLHEVGALLKSDVKRLFSIDNILPQYETLNSTAR